MEESTKHMEQLPELDPFSESYQRDPIAVIDALRAHSPLARSVRGLEVLSYAACTEVYNSEHFFNAAPALASMMGLDFSAFKGAGRTLTNTEGKEHGALRSLVSAWFTRSRVREMRPAVVDLVRQHVAPFSRCGGGDFAADIASKIPATVFCWMVGAHEERAEELFELSNTLIAFFEADPAKADGIDAANQQMERFIDELLADKRARPGDDLMTILLAGVDDGHIDLDDAHALAKEMLGASSDNTFNGACRVVAQLASRPDDWARLRLDRSLVPTAIEECLRVDPAVHTDVHMTEEATQIQGVEIPGGTVAWLNLLAGNYDPDIYEDPRRFDVARRHARPQLNFGIGRHFCLGAALARMELEALVSVLLDEWESLELDGYPAGPLPQGSVVSPLPILVHPFASA